MSGSWIRPEKRRRIYERDGWACVYCGGTDSLTLDHITPRRLRGSNAPTNLVTCCHSCNSRRQDNEHPPADRAMYRALARRPLPEKLKTLET